MSLRGPMLADSFIQFCMSVYFLFHMYSDKIKGCFIKLCCYLPCIDTTRRMPVQRAALCIRNFPSQYRNHFRGLSGHNAGRFNATVFISILSGGRACVSINSPAAANTSLLAYIVRAQTIPSARECCTCSGVWRSVTIPS